MEISSCACAACIFFSAFAIDYLYAVSVCFQLNHMGFFFPSSLVVLDGSYFDSVLLVVATVLPNPLDAMTNCCSSVNLI
jgi:hypothetical protein